MVVVVVIVWEKEHGRGEMLMKREVLGVQREATHCEGEQGSRLSGECERVL